MPALRNPNQYRVIWKREGIRRKTRTYATRKAAERWMILLGPEPWKYVDLPPDEVSCCDGYQCDCQGASVREMFEADRKKIPPLEYLTLEKRPVGQWTPTEKGA